MLGDPLKAVIRRRPLLAHAASVARGLQQQHKAKVERERIKRAAAANHIRCPGADEIKGQLRARLRDRSRRHGWPRRKGELHIFVTFQHWDWEDVLYRAFAPFGEISVFEWRALGFDQASSGWLQRRPVMNAAMLEAFRAANDRRPVDAVIGYLSGHNTDASVLRAIAAHGAAVFNVSYDDTLGFEARCGDGGLRGAAALAASADLNLTSVPGAQLGYALHGGLAMFHAEAAQPGRRSLDGQTFRHDVSFVGACYGFRARFIARLRRQGIDVKAFGRGWPPGPVGAGQMTEIFAGSRINLGFSSVGHSRQLMCLKGRDFEVPMSGGLYLTQYHPDLERVFDVGREIATYRNEGDCAATIRELLAEPDAADAIRRAGHARALRDHTYEARWMNVFEMAGLLHR